MSQRTYSYDSPIHVRDQAEVDLRALGHSMGEWDSEVDGGHSKWGVEWTTCTACGQEVTGVAGSYRSPMYDAPCSQQSNTKVEH